MSLVFWWGKTEKGFKSYLWNMNQNTFTLVEDINPKFQGTKQAVNIFLKKRKSGLYALDYTFRSQGQKSPWDEAVRNAVVRPHLTLKSWRPEGESIRTHLSEKEKNH